MLQKEGIQMVAMQYKISLQDEFNVDTIRQRVSRNGHKTDGFLDLLFKAYLITERSDSETSKNEYSPLYVWKSNEGMNTFIFDGFYDNILTSFGWQNINIGIPMQCVLETDFPSSNFALEIERDIPVSKHMERLHFTLDSPNCLGKVLIYHPDKWKCCEFYFYKEKPIDDNDAKVYKILHISM